MLRVAASPLRRTRVQLAMLLPPSRAFHLLWIRCASHWLLMERPGERNMARFRVNVSGSFQRHSMEKEGPDHPLLDACGVNYPASHSYHDTLFVTQTSAAPLHSPSIAATTEETIRASSVQSGIPGDVSHSSLAIKELPYCQVHGTATCRFDPACCVHKAQADCDCPRRPSCCCVHHAGDCCTCVYTPRSGYVNGAYSLIGHDLPSYALHPVSKNGEVVLSDPSRVSKNWLLKDDGTNSKDVTENGGESYRVSQNGIAWKLIISRN